MGLVLCDYYYDLGIIDFVGFLVIVMVVRSFLIGYLEKRKGDN